VTTYQSPLSGPFDPSLILLIHPFEVSTFTPSSTFPNSCPSLSLPPSSSSQLLGPQPWPFGADHLPHPHSYPESPKQIILILLTLPVPSNSKMVDREQCSGGAPAAAHGGAAWGRHRPASASGRDGKEEKNKSIRNITSSRWVIFMKT
jgi:hypothetical protein